MPLRDWDDACPRLDFIQEFHTCLDPSLQVKGVWQRAQVLPAEIGQDHSHPGHLFHSPTLPPLHLHARMLALRLWSTCGKY